MADEDRLLEQIGKLIDEKLKPLKEDVQTVKDTQQEQGYKIDVANAGINHLDTGIKALDAKVDATRAQLERKINKLPQKAD